MLGKGETEVGLGMWEGSGSHVVASLSLGPCSGVWGICSQPWKRFGRLGSCHQVNTAVQGAVPVIPEVATRRTAVPPSTAHSHQSELHRSV